MSAARWVASSALICFLTFAPGAGRAQQIYTWVDEKGVVHATSELSEVPPRHRAAAGKSQNEPPRTLVPAAPEKGPARPRAPEDEPSPGDERLNLLKAAIERAERSCKYSSSVKYRRLLPLAPGPNEGGDPRQNWRLKRDQLARRVAEKQRQLEAVQSRPDDYGVVREGGKVVDDAGNVEGVAQAELTEAEEKLQDFLHNCPPPDDLPFVMP